VPRLVVAVGQELDEAVWNVLGEWGRAMAEDVLAGLVADVPRGEPPIQVFIARQVAEIEIVINAAP
jgi:hypothetical protein